MKEPTIYADLVNSRTSSHQTRVNVRARLATQFENLAGETPSWVVDLLREVYVAGVTDGFAQGVAAAAEEKQE